eukprot:2935991-Amphidinium_carterae.1
MGFAGSRLGCQAAKKCNTTLLAGHVGPSCKPSGFLICRFTCECKNNGSISLKSEIVAGLRRILPRLRTCEKNASYIAVVVIVQHQLKLRNTPAPFYVTFGYAPSL